VKLQIPNVEFVIAGSNPVRAILDACDSNPNIKLMANVQDPFKMMCQSKVLVNPIATGGGVMVKMLDMLMTNQPIITMPQGLYGLPTETRDAVSVASSPSEFASQIVKFLNLESRVDLISRDQVRRSFSSDKIKELVDLIQKETS
jgi:glycosyltransferase involved in cell wall biosynthesis